MSKKKNVGDKYTNIDTVLDQGIRSRYSRAVEQLEKADDFLPEDAYAGTSEDINKTIRHLNETALRLNELLVYRKIAGVD